MSNLEFHCWYEPPIISGVYETRLIDSLWNKTYQYYVANL